jgi:hypothetical protein
LTDWPCGEARKALRSSSPRVGGERDHPRLDRRGGLPGLAERGREQALRAEVRGVLGECRLGVRAHRGPVLLAIRGDRLVVRRPSGLVEEVEPLDLVEAQRRHRERRDRRARGGVVPDLGLALVPAAGQEEDERDRGGESERSIHRDPLDLTHGLHEIA